VRKKSGKKAAVAFKTAVENIAGFIQATRDAGIAETHKTWMFDYGIIRLYREFENLILSCLIAAINNDTTQLSKTTDVTFPKHLNDEVCEFIIAGNGYFDFKGRDGLIKTLKDFLPNDHYLVTIIRKDAYRDTIERLCALRNFAAHDSRQSKQRLLNALEMERISSSGAWLKVQGRMTRVITSLTQLSDEIDQQAPY